LPSTTPSNQLSQHGNHQDIKPTTGWLALYGQQTFVSSKLGNDKGRQCMI
jgi:hypothetical protein